MSVIKWRDRTATEGILLHDSRTAPDKENLRDFLAVQGRTMGLLEVGYHFLILPGGRIITCRPHSAIGSHCRGLNAEWIGVCLAGGLDQTGEPEDNFTEAQGGALRFLQGMLSEHYAKDLPVRGHSCLRPYHTRRCPAMSPKRITSWIPTPPSSPSSSRSSSTTSPGVEP